MGNNEKIEGTESSDRESSHHEEQAYSDGMDGYHQSPVYSSTGCIETERKKRKKNEEDKNCERVQQLSVGKPCEKLGAEQHEDRSVDRY